MSSINSVRKLQILYFSRKKKTKKIKNLKNCKKSERNPYLYILLNILRTIIFSSRFLLANNQVLRVLIGCNRQLLLIKIYTGNRNTFKKVHHLQKL